MKILLDESLPRKLKTDFGSQYEIKTVRDLGWLGKKNGELLRLMTEVGFDFFVTVDRNIKNQQNLSRFPIIIFILIAPNNRRETLQSLIEKVKVRIIEENLEKVIEIR